MVGLTEPMKTMRTDHRDARRQHVPRTGVLDGEGGVRGGRDAAGQRARQPSPRSSSASALRGGGTDRGGCRRSPRRTCGRRPSRHPPQQVVGRDQRAEHAERPPDAAVAPWAGARRCRSGSSIRTAPTRRSSPRPSPTGTVACPPDGAHVVPQEARSAGPQRDVDRARLPALHRPSVPASGGKVCRRYRLDSAVFSSLSPGPPHILQQEIRRLFATFAPYNR